MLLWHSSRRNTTNVNTKISWPRWQKLSEATERVIGIIKGAFEGVRDMYTERYCPLWRRLAQTWLVPMQKPTDSGLQFLFVAATNTASVSWEYV